ncbi:MAG: hypothetical protein WC718_01310 [Phycisphaerales bacterium]|jgi:hypothetical protein
MSDATTVPRAPGDWGSYAQAVDWALDHNPDGELEAGTFLRCWREGSLKHWPEYLQWLAEQDTTHEN